MKSAFPPGFLQQRLAIVGRSGFGKTNVAKLAAEEVLASGGRVGIFDPTDSWFGLRFKPDGVKPAFKVVIFGGEYADLPLDERTGATIGEALAKAPDSWIVSFAEMVGEGARRRFAAEFLSALYDHNRAPLTLIVDEADTFAPQRANSPAEHVLVSRLEQIVKRGRRRGFIPWLVTQRPADIAKAVLSQADALISLSLTLPHDRKAIESWVAEHDTGGDVAAMFRELPKFPRGQGVMWWPGGDVLDRRAFPLSRTFDSGKTPAPGDHRPNVRPLDVGELKQAVAALIEERAANDPAKLRATIEELQRENSRLAAVESVDAANLTRGAHENGYKTGWAAAMQRVRADTAAAIGSARAQTRNAGEWIDKVAELIGAAVEPAAATLPMPPAPPPARSDPPAAKMFGNGRDLRPAAASPTVLYQADSKLKAGELKLLTVMAQYRGRELSAATLGAIAGFSAGGGTFRVYVGNLRKLGLVQPGALIPTIAGTAALGAWQPLPTGPAALGEWAARLKSGERAILFAIRDAGGTASREDIGRATGFAPTGGTFRVYTGKLKTLGIVVGSDPLQLHKDLT